MTRRMRRTIDILRHLRAHPIHAQASSWMASAWVSKQSELGSRYSVPGDDSVVHVWSDRVSVCQVEIPAVLSHASIPGDESHIPQDLVRISVGIEDIADLLADLR
jgi:hypothetical protein